MVQKNICFIFLALLLSVSGLVSVLHSFSPLIASETSVENEFLTHYLLPNNGAPRYLAHDNGAFWFTSPGENAIGRLIVTSTIDYSFTFYPLPTSGANPYDLVVDEEVIWFTERAANQIGKLNTVTGQITEYSIPTPDSQPTGIAKAPNGSIWFVQQAGNHLARFDPSSGIVTDEYPYPRANALLEDLITTPTGSNIWVTAPGVNAVANFFVGTEEFVREVPTSNPALPGTFYVPSQLVIDANSNLWLSTKNGILGRYSPATVQFFRWYLVGKETSHIDGLFWQPYNNYNRLWFTESNTGFAGQLTTENDGGRVSTWRFPVSNQNDSLYGIWADGNGTAWIANSGQHQITSWQAPYFLSLYLPNIQNEAQ